MLRDWWVFLLRDWWLFFTHFSLHRAHGLRWEVLVSGPWVNVGSPSWLQLAFAGVPSLRGCWGGVEAGEEGGETGQGIMDERKTAHEDERDKRKQEMGCAGWFCVST